MKESVVAFWLLASALGPLAAAAEGRCHIRRAEATVCPVFQVIESRSQPLGLSGDGRTVVGSMLAEDGRSLPMRWIEGEPAPLEGLPDFLRGHASAASRDGSVVGGSSFREEPFAFYTFLWSEGRTRLLDGGPGFVREPLALSGDGSAFPAQRDLEGSRWSEETGVFEDWHFALPGIQTDTGIAEDISDDGRRIVGFAWDAVDGDPLLWEGDVTTHLPTPMGTNRPLRGLALAIEPGGRIVAGQVTRCEPQCVAYGALWRDGVFEPRDHPAVAASWEAAFVLERGPDGPLLGRTDGSASRTLDAILQELGIAPAEPVFAGHDLSYDGHVVTGRTTLAAPAWPFRAVISPKLGIDVMPWRRSNRIDLARRRFVRVRVYGSEQADASDIDPQDLRFGPDRAPVDEAFAPRDYNRDGFPDRDFRFPLAAAGLALGDEQACLAGVAADLPFRLCSHVRTVWGASPRRAGRH